MTERQKLLQRCGDDKVSHRSGKRKGKVTQLRFHFHEKNPQMQMEQTGMNTTKPQGAREREGS